MIVHNVQFNAKKAKVKYKEKVEVLYDKPGNSKIRLINEEKIIKTMKSQNSRKI
jgi:hypothetical protein